MHFVIGIQKQIQNVLATSQRIPINTSSRPKSDLRKVGGLVGEIRHVIANGH